MSCKTPKQNYTTIFTIHSMEDYAQVYTNDPWWIESFKLAEKDRSRDCKLLRASGAGTDREEVEYTFPAFWLHLESYTNPEEDKQHWEAFTAARITYYMTLYPDLAAKCEPPLQPQPGEG